MSIRFEHFRAVAQISPAPAADRSFSMQLHGFSPGDKKGQRITPLPFACRSRAA
jgi:hypothetical protein